MDGDYDGPPGVTRVIFTFSPKSRSGNSLQAMPGKEAAAFRNCLPARNHKHSRRRKKYRKYAAGPN